MKRLLLLPASLLLLCAACTTAPTNTANTNTNAANTNAANANSTAATTTAASWTDDDVANHDRQAWDAIKRKDSAAFADALADDFIDVTPVGIKNKAQTVDFVKTFDLTDVTLSDFKTVRLGKSAAAVTYTVRMKGSIGGRPIPENESAARASTAKVWRGGKWLAVYHQTSFIAAAPPPPPAAAASPAATTAASPAVTVVQPTDNVMANEEAVWDALRRKDWDAFASFIAEDQIEVEPSGVHDKAGTLSVVKQFDFSNVKISELRVMGVGAGDEAKLVTYRVTGTAPDKTPINEYAATIWALRNGQWRAVFHQGTSVQDTGP
jgi:hypothetical protein